MAVLKTGLTSMGKSLASNLTDTASITGFIIAAFKKFVELGFKANKETTSLSKTLASSMGEARGLRNTFVDIENGSIKINGSIDKLFLTTANLTKAYGELASIFGTSLGFTNQQVADQVLLTEQIGLSGEEASGLQQLMLASGMTADQIVDSTIRQTSALARQKGIQLDNKKILGEVAKVSGQLRAQYQNNPDLIAKAVIQTQKLGMSLQQASDASKGLLDFESSINAELEAELLTGRDINLDRARFLRLNGKVAESMQEIFNEVGDINDFMNMNTIQQESLANLAGMTTDELANTLLYQSNLNNLGKTTKKQISDRVEQLKKEGQIEKANQLMRSIGNEEEAKAALGRMEAQDRIAKLLVKLESMFGNIIAPIAEELLGKLEEYIKQIDFEKLARDTKGFVTELVKAIKSINDIAKKLSNIFPEGTGTALAGFAGTATVGLLVTAIGNSLTKGTLINPMVVTTLGGGMDPKSKGVPGSGLLFAGTALAGLGASYAFSSAAENEQKAAKLRQEAKLATDEKERKKKQEEADAASFKKGQQNVTGGALTGAAVGLGAAGLLSTAGVAMSSTGIGALIGIPLLLGAAYMASQELSGDDKPEPVEDAAISKTGLVAAKYSKGKLKPIAQGSPDDNLFFTPNKVESSPLTKNITQPLGDKTPNIVVELKENKIDQTQTVKISMIEVLMSKIDSLITTIYTQISNLTPKINLDNLTTVVNVDLPKFDTLASKLDLFIDQMSNLMSKFNLDDLTTVVNVDLPKFDNVASKLDSLINQNDNVISKVNNNVSISRIEIPLLEVINSSISRIESHLGRIINKTTPDKENIISIDKIETPSPLIDTNTTISETNINKPIRENDNVERAIKRLEESFVKAIGAIKDRPIEIHTVAEIDGEKAGRTLSRYASSNGTTIDVFSVKTQ